MKNFGKKHLLIASLLTMSLVNSAHAALTCTLNRSVTGASATGTLILDKIGSLTAANFTAWNITVTTSAAVSLTNLNGSTLVPASAMTSAANSLTITSTDTQYFEIWLTNPATGQFYAIVPTTEVFRYDGTPTGQIFNSTSVPNPLVLPCTCVTDANVTCPVAAVSAPVDTIFSRNTNAFVKEVPFK